MKNFIKTIEQVGMKVVSISCERENKPVISINYGDFNIFRTEQSIAGLVFDAVEALKSDNIVLDSIIFLRKSHIVVIKFEKL